MNDLISVKEVHRKENLLNSLGSIFFSELSLFADSIEEFSTGRKLGHNVIFVLGMSALQLGSK